jgi:Short C-terminal domain
MATDELRDQPAAPPEDGERAVAPEGGGPQPEQPAKISRGRLIFVDSLIAVTTLLLVVGIFATWANRLLFSPDNWSNTSTQLLNNPTIRSATANYTIDQLYANVNVAGLIKSALPPRLQPLASPAAGALRNVAVTAVDTALTRPRVQDLWAKANRAADQTFIAVVNGGKGAVGVKQGVVTLDLASVVDNVASRLGLPPNLGAKLPASVANLTVFKSNQLKFVQDGGKAVKGLALWLTILVPLLYALAIFLARGHRRRTLMTVGFAAVIGGVLVILGRSILVTQVTNSLTSDASLRPAISDVVSISTQMLHQIAAACVVVGVPLVIAAWFAGPARPARAVRLAIAPSLRESPVGWYLGTLGVMLLIFIWDPIHATGTPAGIIVFTLLALFGMFMLRRETMREFPDAQLGDATRRVRARIEKGRDQRRQAKASSAPAPASIPDQLRELADLRDKGAITPDDYQAAKAQILHG